jgi:integrase
MPGWDLSVVLEALKEGPFEPMRRAALKWVTFKTIFLIALASAKRRGELHSLRFDTFSRTEDWSSVTLRPDPAFISKTELAGKQQHVLKPITIHALKFASGHVKDRDRTLCPVRALKLYLRKSAEFRDGKQKLFVSFKPWHKEDICKNTISFWIRKAIYSAYDCASDTTKKIHGVKAHDVRSLASSWAFLQNISLEEVMDACSWRSSSTFIRHYLKDMTEVSGDLRKLGPIVVAQHQV